MTHTSSAAGYTPLEALPSLTTGWRRQIGQIVFEQFEVRVISDAQFVETPEIDRAGSTIGAIYGVALLKQKLREVGAVLPVMPVTTARFLLSDTVEFPSS